MAKKSKPLFLPRDPKAYWTFTCTKLLMQLILVIYFVFVIVWTFYTMQYFKNLVEDLNEKNPYGNFKSTSDTIKYIISGREIQKLQTHRHFFLFTGLFLIGSSLIAFYGILKELISLLIGFILMQALSLVFEYVGALKSNDNIVLQFKMVSLFVQPLLMLLAAIFAFMIRRMEQKLASEPTYRQTIIGVVPNLNNYQVKKNQQSDGGFKKFSSESQGQVNVGLNMNDE